MIKIRAAITIINIDKYFLMVKKVFSYNFVSLSMPGIKLNIKKLYLNYSFE